MKRHETHKRPVRGHHCNGRHVAKNIVELAKHAKRFGINSLSTAEREALRRAYGIHD
jgi:hypothetical protein